MFLINAYIGKFTEFGLDYKLLDDALWNGEVAAISELSLCLSEKIIEARKRTASGDSALASRGKIIPNKLIDWAIVAMLETIDMPRELMVLARERLGGPNLGFRRKFRKPNKKAEAVSFAASMMRKGIEPSYSMIAASMNASKSAVSRWFKNPKEMRDLARELLRLTED